MLIHIDYGPFKKSDLLEKIIFNETKDFFNKNTGLEPSDIKFSLKNRRAGEPEKPNTVSVEIICEINGPPSFYTSSEGKSLNDAVKNGLSLLYKNLPGPLPQNMKGT